MRPIIALALVSLLYTAGQPYTANATPTMPTDNFLDPTLTPPDGSAWSDGVFDTYAELCPSCYWGHSLTNILESWNPTSGQILVWNSIVIAPDTGEVGVGSQPIDEIPEPGTLALLAAGLVAVRLRLTKGRPAA